MWLYVFVFLLFLLLSFYKQKEPLTIHIDSDTIHQYTVLPIYRRILYFIPYKHHFRKARRYFKSS